MGITTDVCTRSYRLGLSDLRTSTPVLFVRRVVYPMSDLHAYRASDELAAALREFKVRDDAFCERIRAFDEAHPGHELLWTRSGFTTDRRAVGFRDGTTDIPPGLSRAKTRVELIPKKTKTARLQWQSVLDEMNDRPKVEPVLVEHGVPTNIWRGQHIGATHFADAGDDGVIVFNVAGDLTDEESTQFSRQSALKPTTHLTPIPLSEFYRIKEKLDAERVGATT